jgi:peptide-methionine (S)-S-oxide reductase
VVRTRVGYSGGTTEAPTYRIMGDHTETIQVDFDPTTISYEELIQEFWKNHNPLRDSQYKGRQYISIILYHNDRQKDMALRTKGEWEIQLEGEIQTEIAPLTTFYVAEDYHQKYYLKRRQSTIDTLSALYQTHEALVNATLTARLNGFVKGYGTLQAIKKEIREDWGLTLEEQQVTIELLNSIRW